MLYRLGMYNRFALCSKGDCIPRRGKVSSQEGVIYLEWASMEAFLNFLLQ